MSSLQSILRPKVLKEVVGHEKLLSKHGTLTKILSKKPLSSLVFWGPPGCGKTTLAKIIISKANIETIEFHPAFLREKYLTIFEKVKQNFLNKKQTILFLDELHLYHKSQQDKFLSYVEKDMVILIGTTTINPRYLLLPSLFAKSHSIRLEKLEWKHLKALKIKAEKYYNFPIPITENTLETLLYKAQGDAWIFLNSIEEILSCKFSWDM